MLHPGSQFINWGKRLTEVPTSGWGSFCKQSFTFRFPQKEFQDVRGTAPDCTRICRYSGNSSTFDRAPRNQLSVLLNSWDNLFVTLPFISKVILGRKCAEAATLPHFLRPLDNPRLGVPVLRGLYCGEFRCCRQQPPGSGQSLSSNWSFPSGWEQLVSSTTPGSNHSDCRTSERAGDVVTWWSFG